MPLLESRQSRGMQQDLPRALFFRVHPHWDNVPKRALIYTISFARRYAEQGEYEISGGAISTLVGINAAYVETSGKTFFSPNPLFARARGARAASFDAARAGSR